MSAHAYWDTWVTLPTGQVVRQIPYSALNLSKITVGSRDFVIKGHKTQITRWLLDHQSLTVVTDKGYGKHIHLILREVAPTAGEELAKAWAGNFAGVSGVGTGVVTMTNMAVQTSGAAGGQVMGAAQTVLTNPSAFSADAVGDLWASGAQNSGGGTKKPSKFARAIDRIFGSSMFLRISAAQGTFSNTGAAKNTVGELPSGSNCAAIAGRFASLDS